MAFYQFPSVTAMFFAVITAFAMTREPFNKSIHIFSRGASKEDVITMLLIYVLAGAFSAVAGAMGGRDATVNLGLSVIAPQYLTAGMFIISAFMGTATGTSMGTIGAIVPIAVGLADKGGLSMPLMVGACIGGAMFGDNLSMISDTTIAATKSQGCEMKDKFRLNFYIALPAAVLTMLILLFIGRPEHAVNIAGLAFDPLKVLPYLAVLLMALLGMNVFLVLTCGIFLSGIIGMLTGSIDLFIFAQNIWKGFTSMDEVFFLTLFCAGMSELVMHNGGLAWLVQKLQTMMKGARSAGLFALRGPDAQRHGAGQRLLRNRRSNLPGLHPLCVVLLAAAPLRPAVHTLSLCGWSDPEKSVELGVTLLIIKTKMYAAVHLQRNSQTMEVGRTAQSKSNFAFTYRLVFIVIAFSFLFSALIIFHPTVSWILLSLSCMTLLLLHKTYGLFQPFPVRMVGQRACAFCRITQVHHHQYFFIFRQAESFGQFIRVKEVNPAAVHSFISGSQNHMCRYDRRVLHAGIPLAARIGEHISLIIGNDQDSGRAVTARCNCINLGQSLIGLYHIYMLLLQVLCGGSQSSRFQDGCQLLTFYLLCTELFAGIAVLHYIFKFHYFFPPVISVIILLYIIP